jgi:3-oxoacyl-[acyl-carrier protein] reductase
MKYADKQVVITGDTRGVGAMLKDYFESEGATVHGLSRSAGYDVGDPFAVRAAMPPEVDILINNAGLAKAGYALVLSPQSVEAMVRTNLLGPFYVSREAARRMRGRGGRIVNIGSIAVPFEDPGTSIYAATKAGVETMAGILAKEFASWGITVNTLGLSAFPTEMFAEHSPETQADILARLPLPRVATPDDICNVVDFFCSERSSYITGQVVYLGGAR